MMVVPLCRVLCFIEVILVHLMISWRACLLTLSLPQDLLQSPQTVKLRWQVWT